MYGLRSVTPFVIGLGDVRPRKFLLLDSLSALTWAIIVSVTGFVFGAVLKVILADVRHYEREVILSILALGALIWILLFLRKELKKRLPNGPAKM